MLNYTEVMTRWHRRTVMKPRLVETFKMIGDDARVHTIQRWQGFRLLKKGMLLGDTDQWMADSTFDLRTEDGRKVSRVSGEDEVYQIEGTNIKLYMADQT